MPDTKRSLRVAWPLVVKRGSATVKIYRTPCRGKDRCTVCYWLGGARMRQTFDELARARAEAERVANQLTNGDLDVLTLDSEDRAAYLLARRILDPLGVSLGAAVSEFAEAYDRLDGVSLGRAVDFYLQRHPQKLEPRTVAEVVAELIGAKRQDGASARYLKTLNYELGRFARQFPQPIAEVRGVDVGAWLRGEALGPRSRNNFRNMLRMLFAYAKGRGYLPRDHEEMDALSVVKLRDDEIEISRPGELAELLAVAEGRFMSGPV